MTKTTLREDANTHAATLNELLFAYYVNGDAWWNPAMSALAREKTSRLTPEMVRIHRGRAKAMSAAFLAWARESQVRQVQWVGRDRSSLHPADVIVTFKSGRVVGCSLKSTASHTDEVGFANPGVVRLETALGVSLSGFRDRVESLLTRQYDWPEGYAARRDWLQAHPRLSKEIAAAGVRVLGRARDAVLAGFRQMDDQVVRHYLLRDWLQVDAALDPPYVIVVGRGVEAPFSASVRDPLVGAAVEALKQEPLSFVALGQGSVAVWAGSVPVLCVRLKFAKAAFASSLEVIGEPFSGVVREGVLGFEDWMKGWA